MTASSEHKINPLLRFSALFLFLLVVYAAWLVACWPGILGQDSLAIMLEVDTRREFQANKPAFWYMYVNWLYGTSGRVEVPIGFQMLISAIVCARILHWLSEQRMWKSFAYCLFFVALAPSVIYYSSSLYSDGIYAIALSGMLFEVWRSWRLRAVDKTAVLMLALTVPFALFARPNGVLNLLPLLALAWVLPRSPRIRLLMTVLPWCLIGLYGQITYKYNNPIGSIFPLALYETVGFLEHRPMGLWERNEPRVTPKTVEALTSTGRTLEHIAQFHDHYYWDPLIFFANGPTLLALPPKAKRTILREFFKYNLWHNLPAFAASRVNIFLYSMLANGGIPGPTTAQYVLPKTQSVSTLNAVEWATTPYLRDWFEFSMRYRALLWAPWVGLAIIFIGCHRVLVERTPVKVIIIGTYVVQLAAVFTFSIAGEYRYLLAFFTAPLVLLPVLYHPANAHA
ncbi:hypothetical protein QY917_16815 [Diaphorobacter sp. C33]|uniref:Dolichyl-phosphate-mannose-protein mannosyltransferase n=1 Tax=Diaphorobacter nitroreducens TaxID=164759 RepID=A0AAX1X0Q0_9BURK|nr:hypothetical protein [Diaphorobacter sp. C33]ROR50563.1 hypothetical protein EDC60_0316 [Diaphorobacter nitroreducens]WKK89490.1 hypothetical protein QY917_16815 [Diaphorobacter sp. C33]